MLKYERFTPQSPSSEILWKDEMWVTPHLSWPTGRSWLAPQMVLGFSICSMNVGPLFLQAFHFVTCLWKSFLD